MFRCKTGRPSSTDKHQIFPVLIERLSAVCGLAAFLQWTDPASSAQQNPERPRGPCPAVPGLGRMRGIYDQERLSIGAKIYSEYLSHQNADVTLTPLWKSFWKGTTWEKYRQMGVGSRQWFAFAGPTNITTNRGAVCSWDGGWKSHLLKEAQSGRVPYFILCHTSEWHPRLCISVGWLVHGKHVVIYVTSLQRGTKQKGTFQCSLVPCSMRRDWLCYSTGLFFLFAYVKC